MLIFMRTTIVVDDDLIREAKKQALETHRTLSDLISDVLREALRARPSGPPTRFRMATFGGKRKVHHEPADFASILDAEDHPPKQ